MKTFLSIVLLFFVQVFPCYGEMYKWVDEKGTVHFADDLSNIPEKFRPDAQIRKDSKETQAPETRGKTAPAPPSQFVRDSDNKSFEADLVMRSGVQFTEVVLNRRVKGYFIIDTGASFTLISHSIAKELGIVIDENTPVTRMASVTGVALTPMVTLESVQVGGAEAENVEALVYNMPGYQGLLGNSFLYRFRMVLDSINAKLTLFSAQGDPSADRPGGFNRDYWSGQFRFYHANLEELRRLKARYESQGAGSELKRIESGIRYFENQLGELERRASSAGVPRNWRE
jgi:clan AA aspartic protease (TIGR02281 family)